MRTRPLEVFVTVAALGGLVYLFWHTRANAAGSATTAAAATGRAPHDLGQEIGPRMDVTFGQEQALSQWVMQSGATDPAALSDLVDTVLTQPAGVGLFFNAAAPSPQSTAFASL